VGYLLISPIRRLFHNPQKILASNVGSGMRVLEVGPGMGFFTLTLARLVGPNGRVICVDIQERMLSTLIRRARRANVAERIEARVCAVDSLRATDLARTIDFVLAFAVVHEIGNASRFFGEVENVLKPGGRVLFAEPRGHVSERDFQESLSAARQSGLQATESLNVTRSHAVILRHA